MSNWIAGSSPERKEPRSKAGFLRVERIGGEGYAFGLGVFALAALTFSPSRLTTPFSEGL